MPEGDKNNQISDADEKLGQIADMIRDATAKFDSLGSRMDSMEERFDKGRKDSEDEEKAKACRDEDEMADKARRDAEEDEKAKADKARRDAEEATKVVAKGDPLEPVADKRKDAVEEADKRVADALADSAAKMDEMRLQIAALQARGPAMLADADRERFAVIQEAAEPAYQAFGDRAPGPLDGETPTQYKRRLGAKLQSNSPKWAGSRLSAVSDDNMLDVILADVYADSIAAARSGADVPAGQLREVSRQVGGHIINEFVGEPESWMGGFVGQVKRAGGGRA